MVDALGYRLKVGVLAPSTNTIVEPDYYSMSPRGVTFHMGRVYIGDQTIDVNTGDNISKQINNSIEDAIKNVLTCEPDVLLMGMSLETFRGGKKRNQELEKRFTEMTGLKVYLPANACINALEQLNVKRLGILTPYQPAGDQEVRRFFNEWGYDVVQIKGLKCPTATSIAHVSENELQNAILEIDEPEIDVILQLGTNLSMVKLGHEAERWLNKPIITINSASVWHVLRSEGIKDKIYGYGSLLSNY